MVNALGGSKVFHCSGRLGLSGLALACVALFILMPGKASHAGTIVKASCPCGYSKTMPLFGGMRNFKTVCKFPALDSAKADITLYNVYDYPDLETNPETTGLVSYAAKELMPEHPGEPVASWNIRLLNKTLILYRGGYVCPRCGKRTLIFESVGFFD